MRRYFIDILKALYYCHEIAKVTHRNIKPSNIVLNQHGQAVLIDFMISKLVYDQSDFIAPELRQKTSKINFNKVDIWSLGLTFFYFITGNFPWNENSKDTVSSQTIDFSLIENLDSRDVLSRMLDRNPDKRPNLRQIFKHPWISSN